MGPVRQPIDGEPRVVTSDGVCMTNTRCVSESGKEPDPRQQEATQSLSQFAARVLDQLSVSAWLPAAALVLAAAFLLQLGSVLDRATDQGRTGSVEAVSGSSATPSPPASTTGTATTRPASSPSPTPSTPATASPPALPRLDQEGAVLQETLSTLAHVGFGGVVLLVIVIVVMTMLTQSFAFEAIRVLEGYWGPFLPLEWLTDLCSLRFRWAARYLLWRRSRLMDEAVGQVERKLRNKEKQRRADLADRYEPFFTDVRLGHLRRAILEEKEDGNPDERTKRWVKNHPWRRDLDATTSRRLTNVETRLRDYPEPTRTLPTRLGNVIRHHEDNTGERNLESFVQRVWHMLPFSLQVQHDEYRTRLDLYCTMVFVFPVLAALAAVRLHPHRAYAATALVVLAVLCWWTYRAAVASARAWGQTLELIAAHVKLRRSEAAAAASASAKAPPATAEAATSAPWALRIGLRRGRRSRKPGQESQTRSIS